MRTIKDADVRKNEILDAADELFNQKGFDGTTISDIIEKVDVARGTIYYHFKSKEDILDALIERYGAELLDAAEKAASDKSIPADRRLMQALMAMNMEKPAGSEFIEQMHRPQNALMHQKSQKAILVGATPILAEIVRDGITEGVFDTAFPYESVELFLAYVNTVFDDAFVQLTEKERLPRIQAFVYNAERVFGTKKGHFAWMAQLFYDRHSDGEGVSE